MNWDTISRKALLEEFSRKCCGECCICVERDNESGECGLIRWAEPSEMITIPVRYGEWVPKANMVRSPYAKNIYCSFCITDSIFEYLYCPTCGTKMRNGRNE